MLENEFKIKCKKDGHFFLNVSVMMAFALSKGFRKM